MLGFKVNGEGVPEISVDFPYLISQIMAASSYTGGGGRLLRHWAIHKNWEGWQGQHNLQ